MEPTANSPRPPDIRTTPNGSPPEAASGEAASRASYAFDDGETAQPDPAQHAPAEALSSWEGPGTAYTLMPRPVAVAPAAQPAPPIPQEPDDSLSVAEGRLLEPAPRPAVNWPMIGSVVFGTLLTALAITLWEPWAIDQESDIPAIQESGTSSPLAEKHSLPASGGQHAPIEESTVPLTQKPMDDGPMVIPPSEPVPEDLPAARPDTATGTSETPMADVAAQTPAAQVPEQPTPTTPAAPVLENLPAALPDPNIATSQPTATDAAVQASSAPVAKSPTPAAPTTPARKDNPVPSPYMTVTGRKPASPTKPRSAPAPTATGTLTVAVQPWGEVWIDDRKLGISPPLLKLQLPPGSYTVELRNAELPSYSQKVQISAGQSVTLRHSFQ